MNKNFFWKIAPQNCPKQSACHQWRLSPIVDIRPVITLQQWVYTHFPLLAAGCVTSMRHRPLASSAWLNGWLMYELRNLMTGEIVPYKESAGEIWHSKHRHGRLSSGEFLKKNNHWNSFKVWTLSNLGWLIKVYFYYQWG